MSTTGLGQHSPVSRRQVRGRLSGSTYHMRISQRMQCLVRRGSSVGVAVVFGRTQFQGAGAEERREELGAAVEEGFGALVDEGGGWVVEDGMRGLRWVGIWTGDLVSVHCVLWYFRIVERTLDREIVGRACLCEYVLGRKEFSFT